MGGFADADAVDAPSLPFFMDLKHTRLAWPSYQFS